MTTIVYDHENQQIAVDSRVTAGTDIVTDACFKEELRNGDTWFCAGSTADSKMMMDCFYSEEKASRDIDGTGAIMVNNGNVHLVGIENGLFWHHTIYCNRSIGSGGHFAIAALDHGKTAMEAVEYACTRDSGSGGKVRVFDISAKGVFLR